MKMLLLAMTAIPALAAATPAAAQYPYQSNSYANVDAGSSMLRAQLQAGIQQGTISRREAGPLIQRLNTLARLEYQYGRNGFNGRERADLEQRARSLHQQIGYADNRGYDPYQQGNRYGNYQGGYYGSGGPYQEYYPAGNPSTRGGIGGVIDTLLGGGSRDGRQVSGNLYAVPYEYQGQFRDGNGVYYRSDGRSILEIDARTNTVIRAYPMNR